MHQIAAKPRRGLPGRRKMLCNACILVKLDIEGMHCQMLICGKSHVVAAAWTNGALKKI